MSTLDSRLLMVGAWDSQILEKWGALAFRRWEDRPRDLKSQRFEVIALSLETTSDPAFQDHFENWKKLNPFLQILPVCSGQETLEALQELHSKYHFTAFLDSFQDRRLDQILIQSLSQSQEQQQDEQLSLLQSEEAHKLEALQNELEHRVEKRARYLSEMRRKLFVTHERVEAFQRLLVQLPSARSLQDLESLMNDCLSRLLKVQWIKIVLKPDDESSLQELRQKFDYQIHRLFLYDRHDKRGSIFLMASEPRTFTKDESEFLNQVAEAISLSLDAIQELEKLAVIKAQWEKTFEALSDPLLLIDENYFVIQSNVPSQDGSGPKKCHQLLFDREAPCPGCKLGQTFQVAHRNQTWEVRGQKILSSQRLYAHFYRDVTENLEIQRRLLETSRLVEMGTISSSLAHELNNPLAGLLTFAQMLKMDLKPDDPLRPDVEEIERAILKCRDIVQNLLLYARDPGLDKEETVDLVELMQRFLKILEIPTRLKGLKIKPLLSDKPIYCQTRQTWLLSVWKSLALWALQALEKARQQDPNLRNEIIVSLSESATEIQWNLEVDSDLTDQESPLPLISSFEKILSELRCRLSIERVHGRGSRAKISLPRDSRPARKPAP
ncbi:MAG: histidine kinase dimerization/phospho-acceptor domain-containing protein [Bdellovibrionales bacterium]